MMRSHLIRTLPVVLLATAAACTPDEPPLEETLVIGQMLRGGQTKEGDSYLSFDVMMTERGNGPAIDCARGELSVEVEVSTDRGRRYSPLGSTHLNVLCEGSVGPDIALVVDNSGSQRGQLDVIRAATSQLANDVHEMGGRTSVVRVSTEARVVHDLSSDRESIAAAIDGFYVNDGWTALYDGIRLGNETLGRAEVPEDHAVFGSAEEFCGIDPRRAIVVFTDGKENNSADEHASEAYPGDGFATTFSDVKQLKVRGTKTPIYTIGLGNEVDHQELNRLGNQSGGKHHALDSLDELAETFRNVAGYSGRRFRVCGDLDMEYCGRLDVRMSYTWSDGERTLKGSDDKTITVPCSAESNVRRGRSTTVLMTLSNPGIEKSIASELVTGAVDWVSPVSDPKVLVVLDDFHHDESPEDAEYVVALLKEAGVNVTFLQEPEVGIAADDVAGYDVVWMSNPGYPMDDELSFATLMQLLVAGKGVVLQGDDMASSHGQSFDMSPITHLAFEHNGTSSCNVTTDNNTGTGAYAVAHDAHELLGASSGKSYQYADDIDWTVPKGEGEQVLAWGTVVSRSNGRAQCGGNSGRVPVVVAFDPVEQ